MSVTVLNAATSTRLTTVAAVQAQLSTAGSALTDTLIAAASAAIATYCHRVWGQETVAETLAGSGGRYLGLTRTPLVTIGTVTEDSAAITDYSLDDAAAGRLYREAGWQRGVTLGWGPEAYSSGYILGPWSRGRDPLPTYEVRYTAGYVCPSEGGTVTVTLPADVQQAAIETVKAWTFAGSADPRVVRKQAGDVSVSYGALPGSAPAGPLPPLALALLRPWVQPAFLAGQ